MAGRTQKLSSARTAYLEQKIKHHNEVIQEERLALFGRVTLKNVPLFVVTYGLLMLVRGAMAQYSIDTMSHIQRHYRLHGKELDFLVGCDKIGLAVSLIFVVYYGNKIHKPLALFCSSMLCACATIMCAVPYFLELNNSPTVLELNQTQSTQSDGLAFYDAGLCQIDRNKSTSTTQCELLQADDRAFTAFSLLAAANFILGVATSFQLTLGVIYIEEAAPSDKSAFYYGLIFFLHSFGEFLGLMTAWQLTNISLNLSGPLELSEWDTGAWWLGYVLISGLFLFVPIPFILYPKWIEEPRWLVLRRTRYLNRLLKRLEYERKQLKKSAKKKKKKRPKNSSQKEQADTKSDGNRTNLAGARTNEAFSADGTDDATPSTNDEPESAENLSPPDIQTASSGDPPLDGALHDGTPSAEADRDKLPSDEVVPDEELQNGSSSNVALQIGSPSHVILQNKISPNDLQDLPPNVADTSQVAEDSQVDFSQDQTIDRILQMEEPDNPKSEDNPSESGQSQTKAQKRQYLLGRRLKDLPRNLWFLLQRPVFMLTLAANLFGAYSLTGFRPTVHVYVDTRFPVHQPAGFVVTGTVYTLSTCAGVIIAGCVLYKRTLSLMAHVKALMVLYAISTVLYLVMMAPGCEITYATGQESSSNSGVSVMCNSRCDCSDSQYNPLCDNTGTTVVYTSPCHAGCRDLVVHPQSNKMVYSRCSCAPSSLLSVSYCNICSSGRVGYSMLMMLATFCQALGYISQLQIYLRCITPKLRSLALGFAVWTVHLLASVPGFAAYTALQRTSCTLLVEDCYEETVCWNYRLASLGYIQNGATAVFHLVSLAGFVAVFVVLRRRMRLADENTNSHHMTRDRDTKQSGDTSTSNPDKHDDGLTGSQQTTEA